MAKQFVKIVNRENGYMSPERAQRYVNREFAEPVLVCVRTGRLLEIRMLDAVELKLLRSAINHASRPENVDDGILRRWATRRRGGKVVATRQLRPVREVGLMPGVTGNPDLLTRRQHRRDKGRSVWVNASGA